VDGNTTIESRSGTIVAGGQVSTITQEGISCTYTLSSSHLSLGSEGVSSSVEVSSPDGCEWSASSVDSWIEISSGASSSGSGSISFTVASNESTQSLTAAITIAEQELTIIQGGIDCAYALSPSSASFDSEGGSSSASVASPDGCEWSASASESWISISAGSNGSGDGSATFAVDANTTIQSRSGTIVVGGQVFAVTQDGLSCTYAMSSSSSSFDSEGGSSSVSVTSSEGYEWSASSSDSWITIGTGASGNGALSFAVEANTATEPRSGTITVEDRVLTITQSRIDCSLSLSSISVDFDSDGGEGSVVVTSPDGCNWSAFSGDSWIVVARGDRGTGNGSFLCVVESNPTIQSQSGSLVVEGQTIGVTQAGAECTYSTFATSTLFEGDGGIGSATVSTLDGCNWSASTSVEWITLPASTASSGNGTVEFEVSANPSGEPRTGTIVIEDAVVTLTQAWDSGQILEVELRARSYATGDFVEARSLRLSNTGPEAVESELWMVLEAPGGVHISFFHLGADGTVLIPSQFTEDFGPVTLFEITPNLPRGKYLLTCLVRNATTADLLSQEVKTFVVVGKKSDADDPRDLSTDPGIQSGTPQLSTTNDGWLRSLERLSKPRGEKRKSLPVPQSHRR